MTSIEGASGTAAPEQRSQTLGEIHSQPVAWAQALDAAWEQAPQITSLWGPAPRGAIFTGCGSSYYLGRTAASLFQERLRLAGSAHPGSDIMLYPAMSLGAPGPSALVAISRSGETTEILRAVEAFRHDAGGPVIAITCHTGTKLEAAADVSVVIESAAEVSPVATRSFTSMLLVAQVLVTALSKGSIAGLATLPALGERLLADHGAVARELGTDRRFERLFFLGGGAFFGLACEAMLVVKETSLSHSEAYHFLEFRHGPMTLVDEGALVVGFVSAAARDHELAVLADVRELGATVLAFLPDDAPTPQIDHRIVLPGQLADVDRGPLYLPIVQLIAVHRAVAKGLDPDRPTNLTAVISLD